MRRVPLRDPGAAPRGAPYDFEREGSIPEPRAVEPSPAGGRQEAPTATLETPRADLGAPSVVVQDLAPAPAAETPGTPGGSLPAGGPAPSEGATRGGDEARTSIEAPGRPPSAGSTSGYRVQVFAGDRDGAAKVRAEIESSLGERAYVDFIPPYYKGRVGNCRTGDECRALEARLRQAGYTSIWTVQAQIEP